MLSWLTGSKKETPEEFEARVVKVSEELAAVLGEPGEGEDQDANFLRRFVIANEFDVPKAADHARQERAWRRENLPIVLTEKEKEVGPSGRVRLLGVNPDGFAILAYDFMWGKLLEGFEPEEIVHAMVDTAETALARMREVAPDGPRRWMVVCLGGPPPSAWSRKASEIFERYYPERLERSVIYPVPYFMKRVIDAIIDWLPARTKSKFAILSTEEDLREMLNTPVGGPVELPEDCLGGIEGARERAKAAGLKMAEQNEGDALDLTGMDEQTKADLEKQAEADPELKRILHGAKEDELYRLQMQA